MGSRQVRDALAFSGLLFPGDHSPGRGVCRSATL